MEAQRADVTVWNGQPGTAMSILPKLPGHSDSCWRIPLASMRRAALACLCNRTRRSPREATRRGWAMAVSDATFETNLVIGGEERAAAESFPVYDPASDGEVIGHAAAASSDDALDAVSAAAAAWPAWAALSARERTAKVIPALDGLAGGFDERAELLVRENGKIRFEAEIALHG